MASEKRLIDVSKIINHIQKHIDENVGQKNPVSCFVLGFIIKCLEQEPTVDAVEVVRCKDCKRWSYVQELDEKPHCTLFCGLHSKAYATKPDDFCSYGERKDNG